MRLHLHLRRLGLLLLLLTTRTEASPSCPPLPLQASAEQTLSWQNLAQDHGLLYRIRRDGHDSYLFGTLHVGRPAWASPGPKLRAALTQIQVLALELDLGDAQTLNQLSQPPVHTRPMQLNAATRQRLQAQTRAACLPEQALSALHPLLQLNTLTVLAARWDGMDPVYGQELMLSNWARQQGIPITALETATTQLQALIPADPKRARQILLQGLGALERGKVRPVLARLASAWERGDLRALQDFEGWCDCIKNEPDRADMRRLGAARNPALAERVDALHGAGQSLLVAVGALHLSGPAGLPKLLAARGFELEQLYPPAD